MKLFVSLLLAGAVALCASPVTTSVDPSDGAYPYIQNAVSNYTLMDFSGYEIVSSVDKRNGQQEFVIDTICPAPEPASVGVFGAGLVIAAATSAWLRRSKRSRLNPAPRN